MDTAWLSAPCLAIKVWPEANEWRWRLNPALRAWAQPQGMTTQHWQAFAALLMSHCAHGQRPAEQRVGLLGNPMRAMFHAMNEAWLVWLVEIAAEYSSAPSVPASTPTQGLLADGSDESAAFEAACAHLLTGRLAQAVNLASVAVWRIDLATQRIEFNDFGYRVNGVKPRPGGLPLDLVRIALHPDDRQGIVDASNSAIHCDGVIDVEARYRNPDGSYRTLLTRRVAERDAQGRAVALAGISIDQTARIAEREKTRALASNIDLITDAAGIGVWSIDVASGTVEWNRQMFLMYELAEGTKAPSVTQWLDERLHADDRVRLAKERRIAVEAGSDLETEFRIIRPDGSHRHVVCRSRREMRGGREVAHGIHVDVTQRRLTEGRLHLLEQRALLANQAVGLGTWERDLITDLSQWDAQMYALRGLTPTDPRPPNELRRSCVHPDDAGEMLARAESGFLRGESSDFEFEFRVVWPDGAVHWLNTRGLVLHNDSGRPVRALGVNWDITQRKFAEQAVRDKLTAEQASRTKSEFLSSMSHELRTPLNAVLGFSQLLLLDTSETLAPEQARRVAYIQTAGQHLLALIDDVLDLAAIEAGARPLETQPVAMHEVLADVMMWIAPQAAAHGVKLHTELAPAWVDGDARRLRQIVVNLLTNAVKYNRRDGEVWVTMRRADPPAGRSLAPPVSISGTANSDLGPGWELSVRDTGRGLSAPQLAQIFEPFNRLGVEQEGIEGTGIGLTIVRDLVQRMDGHIAVQSEVGQGTEFRVWWPAAKDIPVPAPLALQGSSAPAGAVPALVGAEPTGFAPLSVLYIEDNPVNVLLIQELLAQRPHISLLCATDGSSGVSMAIARLPDVVLIDMQLPDFDGLEVLRRLKATSATAGLRFVALSANAMPEDVAVALEAGFDDYWTKPVDMKKVLEKLDAWCTR